MMIEISDPSIHSIKQKQAEQKKGCVVYVYNSQHKIYKKMAIPVKDVANG